jgi:hypothetical protein
VVHGNADSGAMNGPGEPGAGESHARFDEGGLETGPGLGTAVPAMKCVDSAGPPGYRASPLLYLTLVTPAWATARGRLGEACLAPTEPARRRYP